MFMKCEFAMEYDMNICSTLMMDEWIESALNIVIVVYLHSQASILSAFGH